MSTTPNLGLTYLTSGQLQPEVTLNADLNALDALLPLAASFANNPATTTGLTYGYYGGYLWGGTTATVVASATVALTASTTNYVQITTAGAVSANTTGFTSGQIPLATVVTGASTITSIADKRPMTVGGGGGGMTNPMTTLGDQIVGGTAGTPTRTAIGTTGQVWTVVSGVPAWAAPGGGVALSNTAPWTANQNVTPVTLTYASTVTPAAGSSNNFELVLTGACTLANPTGLVNGMVLNFCIDQDATGGRVLTLGSLYKWPGGTVPTWVTTASAKNFFSAYYDGAVLRCNGGAGYA